MIPWLLILGGLVCLWLGLRGVEGRQDEHDGDRDQVDPLRGLSDGD